MTAKQATIRFAGLLFLWLSTSCVNASARGEVVCVYVQGMGGIKENPVFVRKLKGFFKSVKAKAAVRAFRWDSPSFDVLAPRSIGRRFDAAKKIADKQAIKFSAVLDRLERAGAPYYVIAFSLGTRIVVKALDQRKTRLKRLKGVIFLGAAIPPDTKINARALPKGLRICNYHSPKMDYILGWYEIIERIAAGGANGFKDTKTFLNCRVSCAHINKGFGLQGDYSQMATAIGYVILYTEKTFVEGAANLNIRGTVQDGSSCWNDIIWFPNIHLNRKPTTILIQQHNLMPSHFRAVSVNGDQRKREAWGNNMHAVLRKVGIIKRPPSQRVA